MIIERQIAQMLMPPVYVSRYVNDEIYRKRIQSMVTDYGVGGFIIFDATLAISRAAVQELQGLSETPLIISCDMEAGFDSRFADSTVFPHAMAIGQTSPELCESAAECIARDARAAGINYNFAPVCDVNNNPRNPIINIRAFGNTPEHVAEYARAFIRGTKRAGVRAVAKHFPGHGDTATDSHLALPTLDFARSRFDEIEFAPFISAINDDVDGVMIAHIIASALDPLFPATLSRTIVTEILRSELHFTGLVFTDALEMHAMTKNYSVEYASVRAAEAGCDILLMPPDFELAYNAIVRETQSNTELKKFVEAANERIAFAKSNLTFPNPNNSGETTDSRAIASIIATKSIAIKGVTLNAFTHESTVVVIAGSANETENMEFAKLLLNDAKQNEVIVYNRSRNQLIEILYTSKRVVLFMFSGVASYSGKLGDIDTFRNIITLCREQGATNIIGVSLGNPYIWDDLPAFSTTIDCFSNSRVSLKAVVERVFRAHP